MGCPRWEWDPVGASWTHGHTTGIFVPGSRKSHFSCWHPKCSDVSTLWAGVLLPPRRTLMPAIPALCSSLCLCFGAFKKQSKAGCFMHPISLLPTPGQEMPLSRAGGAYTFPRAKGPREQPGDCSRDVHTVPGWATAARPPREHGRSSAALLCSFPDAKPLHAPCGSRATRGLFGFNTDLCEMSCNHLGSWKSA